MPFTLGIIKDDFQQGSRPGASALNLNWTSIKNALTSIFSWLNAKVDATTGEYMDNSIPGTAMKTGSLPEEALSQDVADKLNAVSNGTGFVNTTTNQSVSGLKIWDNINTFNAGLSIRSRLNCIPAAVDYDPTMRSLTATAPIMTFSQAGASLTVNNIVMNEGDIITLVAMDASLNFVAGGNIMLPKGNINVPQFGTATFTKISTMVFCISVYGV